MKNSKDPNKLSSYWKTPFPQVYSETFWQCVKNTIWCHIGIKFTKTPSALTKAPFVLFLLGSIALTGCAGVDWAAVGSSVVKDFQDGLVVASDAYAAYSAINQQLTTANVLTGKLDATKVLAAATAINNGMQTPGLATAVQDFVADANTTIAALQAKGTTPTATIAAVSEQGAASVTTVEALAPSTSN